MDYKMVELNEFNVIGKEYLLENSWSKNIVLAKSYWQDFNSNLHKNKVKLGSNWCKYAFVRRVQDKIIYYISIPKSSFVPDTFVQNHICKKKYLYVEHKGNNSNLYQTINQIFKEIIPQLKIVHNPNDFTYFEKYDKDYHFNSYDSIIKIYIPIE